MKRTIKEEITLTDVLSEARIKELPDELSENDITWVKAIVLVTKCDASRNYALAINAGDGKPSIIKDYGSVAKIARIDKIYPYIKLNSANSPSLNNKRDILMFFKSARYSEEKVAEIEALLANKNADGEEKSKEQLEKDRAIVKREIINLSIKNCLLTIQRNSEAKQFFYENRRLFPKAETDN